MSCMTIRFQNLQITRLDVRPHIKLAVSLVIAHGHFNLPQGFVWICMSKHTHFITPEGQITIMLIEVLIVSPEIHLSDANQTIQQKHRFTCLTCPPAE